MSLRTIAFRLLQNGRILLRIIRPQKDVVDGFTNNILPRGVELESIGSRNAVGKGFSPVGWRLQDLQLHARRLFVDNVLNRVTNSLAGDLRRRAAKSLFVGDSAPFFALVGVSLASGAGILTKDDELEGVCWEIRQAVSKMRFAAAKASLETDVWSDDTKSVGLNNLDLGPAIAKGCSAVVYSARQKQNEAVGDVGAALPAGRKHEASESEPSVSEFPFAVKMMFNYDAESNATSILRAMYRETVPTRNQLACQELGLMEHSMLARRRRLSPHVNIVEMYSVFADRVPNLPGSLSLYPDALPARINPDGSGRNMSLFLLMKRYDCSLKQYLAERPPTVRVSTLLLAQLLEAVAHMSMQGVAHRDLKTDNVLLDLSEGDAACPLLVVTDFGCCLADPAHGLSLPYHTLDTDKGGNAALMAPEVACAEPGPFTAISYAKSDAWAAGAIAYELFGRPNPFYQRGSEVGLRSGSYQADQLPELPEAVPATVARLVANLLERSPGKRLSGEAAATVCQLLLWGPGTWIKSDEPVLPSSNEILQWLLCLTTKVLCEGRQPYVTLGMDGGRRTLPEYQLIASFLARVNLRQVKAALRWIHNN